MWFHTQLYMIIRKQRKSIEKGENVERPTEFHPLGAEIVEWRKHFEFSAFVRCCSSPSSFTHRVGGSGRHLTKVAQRRRLTMWRRNFLAEQADSRLNETLFNNGLMPPSCRFQSCLRCRPRAILSAIRSVNVREILQKGQVPGEVLGRARTSNDIKLNTPIPACLFGEEFVSSSWWDQSQIDPSSISDRSQNDLRSIREELVQLAPSDRTSSGLKLRLLMRNWIMHESRLERGKGPQCCRMWDIEDCRMCNSCKRGSSETQINAFFLQPGNSLKRIVDSHPTLSLTLFFCFVLLQ